MRKISATILVYPYPWYSERLVHKDVYQFPDAIARSLKNEMTVLKGWLITGQERDDQSPIVLRTALLVNVLLVLLRLPILRFSSQAQTPCFVFFIFRGLRRCWSARCALFGVGVRVLSLRQI